jgi:hypothetical protein
MDTKYYVELLKGKLGISYYKLTRMLGVTDSTMARWRTGKGGASEETALRIAELAEIDPALVLADIRIEHCKNLEVKNAWQRARKIIESCILCQIVGSTIRAIHKAVFTGTFPNNKKYEGLIYGEKVSASQVGRFSLRRGVHLSAQRSEDPSKSNRAVLVHGRAAPERAARAGGIARARASNGFRFIAAERTRSSSERFTVGALYHNTSGRHYNERNTAV